MDTVAILIAIAMAYFGLMEIARDAEAKRKSRRR